MYDHPDKYIDPTYGGNPYCEGGAEDTRVHLTDSCHWKVTNSTTMTFAAKVSTLKKVENILRKHTSGTHPNDFQMFLELRQNNELLVTSIPGYSTHGGNSLVITFNRLVPNMISVIIPTYKSPEYLDLCLESALKGQTNQNEIIVVVDGYYELNQTYIRQISRRKCIRFRY